MAIYHLSTQVLKRSEGRSATAAAAYRSGCTIADERTGQTFDYTRKQGVLHEEILAPAHAPEWMKDRAQLWNAVEKGEKRKDAQVAREIDVALPHELAPDKQVALVREFVGAAFVAEGMVADFAIHAPSRKGDERNTHAHIMLTMRELEGDGFGKKVRAWNDKERLAGWRESWAAHVNRALEREGVSAQVDHRSLEAQGIDREPQIHQGPAVAELTRRGIETERQETASEIEAGNEARKNLQGELSDIREQIAALERELAAELAEELAPPGAREKAHQVGPPAPDREGRDGPHVMGLAEGEGASGRDEGPPQIRPEAEDERAATTRAVDEAEPVREPTPEPAAEVYESPHGAGETAEAGLRVASDVGEGIGETLVSFLDGVLEFFGGSTAPEPPRKASVADLLKAEGRREEYARQAAERRRLEALDNIREDIAKGNKLKPKDLTALNREDLETIRAKGDDHLLEMVRQREREVEEKKRERDYDERERER